MKFTRDQPGHHSIRRVEPGRIVVGDQSLTDNFGLTAGAVLEHWPACQVQQLDVAALEALLSFEPELLLIGTGLDDVAASRRPPRSLMFELARRSVGLEVMDTRAACRTFNILVAEDRNPAAVIYLVSRTSRDQSNSESRDTP
jgi:uncharacterized protein